MNVVDIVHGEHLATLRSAARMSRTHAPTLNRAIRLVSQVDRLSEFDRWANSAQVVTALGLADDIIAGRVS